MRFITDRRPSPAMIVALIALMASMSGAAIAAKSISSKDIKKNAVRSKHIKKNNVKSSDIKNSQVKSADIKKGNVKTTDIKDAAVTSVKLAADAVDGSKVADGGLSSADIGDYNLLGSSPVKVTATEGADVDTARAAAPEEALFSEGSIEVYAKCLYDTTGGELRGEIYVRTSADGAMMEGTDDLPGSGGGATFLDTTTAEDERQLHTEAEGSPDTARFDETEGAITSAEGRVYHALTNIGAKQGSPAGGNGPFGAGNVCLFGGALFG